MTAPLFIGDEVTAAGYRLAGASTRIVDDDAGVAEIFADALRDAELVIITAVCAAKLPDGRLSDALRTAEPLVLLVPDAAQGIVPADLSVHVDRELGIEP